MTDTYGNEPHDPEAGHDDALTHDHVSEEPSSYEFAEAGEHGAAANEHQEDHTPLPNEISENRRSPMLPILAAVGGVLILGAAAWWQFGSSTESAPPSEMALAVPPQVTPPAETTKNLNTTAPSIADAATSAAPTPAPAAPVTPVAAVSDNTPTTPTTSAALPIQQAAPSAMPVDATMSPATAPSAPPLSTALPSGAPVTPTTSAASDAQRIEALTARVDSLQKSLDQANAQLSQMTNALAATASAPATKDMQDKVDHLEQELAQLHHSAPPLAAPVALPGDMTVTEVTEKPRTPIVPTHKAVHSHKKPKAVIVAQKKKKSAPVTVEAKPVWVLRSASPGQAWVSTSATSSDLKQLQVGDSLAGIGRVTAIQHQGDDWVVQGTQGSIH